MPYFPISQRLFWFAVLVLFGIIIVIQTVFQNGTTHRTSISKLFGGDARTCSWTFDHYVPSDWEIYWAKNIENLQTNVCPTIALPEHFNNSIVMMRKIIEYQKVIYHNTSKYDLNNKIFSNMFYRLECPGKSSKPVLVSQYIEPLTGLLRDPFTICQHGNVPEDLKILGDAAIQSKRFILLGTSAPHHDYQVQSAPTIAPWLLVPGSRVILVDLGASLFNGGEDPNKVTTWIGGRWFYEYFKSKSIVIDKILAFEYKKLDPDIYWAQIPDDIIAKLTFINKGVTKDGKFNPWNMLKTIATKNDYVLVKLDIDTPLLENELINQVVSDPSISSLIDELFFEMHVGVKEMMPHWGPGHGTMKDSYTLFTTLRNLGIRMHSWP